MPNNSLILEFEKGVLSAVLDDAEVLGEVAEIVTPFDFTDPRHQVIFQKALDFYQSGKPLDLIQMAQSLIEDGQENASGGLPYIIELISPNAEYYGADPIAYAEKVVEESNKRTLRVLGSEIAQQASNPGEGSGDIIAFLQNKSQQIANRSLHKDNYEVGEVGNSVLGEIEDALRYGKPMETYTTTGFPEIDRLIGGFAAGQMIILAGRPGHGKTTIALDFARSASGVSGKTVLFFSLEMSKESLYKKVLSAESRVEHRKIDHVSGITEKDLESIYTARDKINNMNLIIDDNPMLDLVSLRAKCLRQKASPQGLDMVFIDYLGLMQAPRGFENRQQQISEISRSLKLLAKELNIPIFALSQLNRGNANRTDKRPMASDLRESGSLEQDADVVMLVHRPEVYDENDQPGIVEVILDKVRSGERGIVQLMSLLEFSKFTSPNGQFVANDMYEEEESPQDSLQAVQDISEHTSPAYEKDTGGEDYSVVESNEAVESFPHGISEEDLEAERQVEMEEEFNNGPHDPGTGSAW